MRGWLQDPDGDGTYTATTTALPAGNYETKVAHGLSGRRTTVPTASATVATSRFDVPAAGVEVVFWYDVASHRLTVSTAAPRAPPPTSPSPRRSGCARTWCAWDLPDADLAGATGCTGPRPVTWPSTPRRSPAAPACRCGYDPAGLPADVLAEFPQLEGYEAFRLDRTAVRRVDEILTGQLVVASYDSDGTLHDATGVQMPGVLDDVYAAAADRELGVTWQGERPTLSLWAPTAQRGRRGGRRAAGADARARRTAPGR